MKTYEIKMNRSRWLSCLIAVLCLALIIMMLCPYFTYGSDSTTLVPENSADGKTMGDQNILYGRTWLRSGVYRQVCRSHPRVHRGPGGQGQHGGHPPHP